jgi:methyltransferase (TIGR00027 family)
MRRRRASRTAQFVAYNRALSNLSPKVPGFSDPVAESFLSGKWKQNVETMRARIASDPSKSPLPFWPRRGMGIFNQFRTVVLDDAIRSKAPYRQLVILGAGLDSRAWRMPEMAEAVVYEVDHPDTQSLKQQRTAGIKPLAEQVRFVPVDFTRDDLASKLRASGYDRNQKTFWLWEGVTMYLTPEQVAQNLSSIAALSSSGSRLALTYMAKKDGKIPKSWFLTLIGEPVRSAFSVEEFERMASAAGWKTASNTGITDWKPKFAPAVALTERSVGMQWRERIWVGSK